MGFAHDLLSLYGQVEHALEGCKLSVDLGVGGAFLLSEEGVGFDVRRRNIPGFLLLKEGAEVEAEFLLKVRKGLLAVDLVVRENHFLKIIKGEPVSYRTDEPAF